MDFEQLSQQVNERALRLTWKIMYFSFEEDPIFQFDSASSRMQYIESVAMAALEYCSVRFCDDVETVNPSSEFFGHIGKLFSSLALAGKSNEKQASIAASVVICLLRHDGWECESSIQEFFENLQHAAEDGIDDNDVSNAAAHLIKAECQFTGRLDRDAFSKSVDFSQQFESVYDLLLA